MKKQIFMGIIILLILNVLSVGCINFNDDKINALDIHIGNISDRTINGTIIILNDNEIEIFNQTFHLEINEKIEYSNLTENEGKYRLIISLDDGRIKQFDRIYVNKFSRKVGIDIENEEIFIAQRVV